MGRLYILLVLAAAAGSSLLFFRSSSPMAMSAEARTYHAVDEAMAREVALSGLADAETTVLQQLARFETPTLPMALEGRHDEGSYTIEIVRDGSLISVTSTGRVKDAEHRVRRSYTPRASAPPPFLRRAIHTGNHIQFRGPVSVTALPPFNTNIHANGHLEIGSGLTLITGFGSTSRRFANTSGLPLDLIFKPNANPGALLSYTEGIPGVRLPAIDPVSFRPQADVVLPRGSSLSGRIALGTRAAPKLIYATDALRTSGPVVVDGWGVLVVEKGFTVDHRITTVGDATRSRLLVVVGQNASIDGDGIDIAGNWMVNHQMQVRTSVRILEGSVTVGHNLQTTDAFTLVFREVAVELSGLLWPDFMVPRSHREW